MTLLPIPWGGCPWPVDTACFTDDWDALDPEVQERSIALASATLRRLTAYRVGGCPITVRPCKMTCAEEYGSFAGGSFHPHINFLGQWVNGCGCSTDCSCGPLCEVQLPGPIGRVDEVNVDGVDLTTDVKIHGNRLVYTGELDCPFPSCQDLSAAPGQPNTFTVTYLNSWEVDALGAYAAAILAMEYAKACTGSRGCRLPTGTTRVARQGVTIDIVAESFPEGRTSIKEVDSFIELWVPPGSPTRAPRVWSPSRRLPRIERA